MSSYTSSKPSTSSNPSMSKSFSSIYQNEAPNMSMTTNPDFPFASPATPGYISKKSRTTHTTQPAYTSEKTQYTSDTASIASTSSAKTLIGKVFGRKSSESSSTTRSKKDVETAEHEAKQAARASYFSTL